MDDFTAREISCQSTTSTLWPFIIQHGIKHGVEAVYR
jgi:hypothetical protein